ncbi:hypothetical protein CFC21_009837 [Triticum aestivum]|uniref:Zinc finger-XS domain-containing protein n=2 Tax=Triticum aestivum TaxID=4565 RepID=A0A9R1DIQ6_WHEAT|nr:hypothetical protein CFC21_009837 [Triticum aestivum]
MRLLWRAPARRRRWRRWRWALARRTRWRRWRPALASSMWSRRLCAHYKSTQKEDLVGNKRKYDMTGFYPYDSDEDEPYEYDSGDDVVEGNVKSFEEKMVEKIRAQGSGMYHNPKTDKFRCPYCSRPKPRPRLMEHLMEHCQATAISGDDYKIRAQHSALLKVLRSPKM